MFFFTLWLWAVHIRQITMCPPPPVEARHISEGARGSETHLRGGTSEVWNYRNTVAFIANYRCTGDDCHEITDLYLHDVSEIPKPNKIYWNYRTIAQKIFEYRDIVPPFRACWSRNSEGMIAPLLILGAWRLSKQNGRICLILWSELWGFADLMALSEFSDL